jgi:hypothetical protein
MAPETTRHPHDHGWRERFPQAARVVAGEGGGVYAAEGADGTSLWLIKDESSMADFMPEEDRGSLVSLTRYSARRERGRWVADAVALRRRFARPAPEPRPQNAATLDGMVVDVVDRTAAAVQRLALRDGLTSVNERDHLQPCCADVARTLARSLDPTPAVSTQLRVEFAAWPRLGSADVALQWPEQLPALIELKCGAGPNAAGQVVWDAAKLASRCSAAGAQTASCSRAHRRPTGRGPYAAPSSSPPHRTMSRCCACCTATGGASGRSATTRSRASCRAAGGPSSFTSRGSTSPGRPGSCGSLALPQRACSGSLGRA